MTLQTIVAFLLAFGASIFSWQSLNKPWLFLTIGTLAMLGLSQVLTQAWAYGRLLLSPVVFLERQAGPSIDQATRSWANSESLIISTALVFIGLALLVLLRKSL